MPMIFVPQTSPPVTASSSITTSSNAAVQAHTSHPEKSWAGGVVWNPPGSAAGQLSMDNFNTDVRPFPAGPSLTFLPSGTGGGSVSVRRMPGGSNVSGAYVIFW